MQVHYDIHHLPTFRQAVITVGSFDGVHLGHRRLIRQVIRLARHVRGESVVVTFDPHPRYVLDPLDGDIPLLTTLDEKIELLEKAGIDHLVVVPFTLEFAQMSADEYIETFLAKRFHPRYIVLGFNHRFGTNRAGDIRFLRWKGTAFGYEVSEVNGIRLENETVSSTRIRQLLSKGDLSMANRFLGHPYMLSGKVVKGEQIGRTLGFPTANIRIDARSKLIPPDGIYAAYAHWGGTRFEAMLYIGRKPTLDKSLDRVIEVHLLDFNEQIYGEHLSIDMVKFIREDTQFADRDALQNQIRMDRKKIRIALEDDARMAGSRKQDQQDRVALVILNYNGLEHLQHYLPDVYRSAKEAGVSTYVVDNGSTDQSVAYLQKEFPEVYLIQLDHNLGFAAGYNHGLMHIDSEYYFLLNSDVALGKGVFPALLKTMQDDPEIAACQPKILDDRHRDQFEYAGAAGGWIDFLGYPFCRGRVLNRTEKDLGQYDQKTEIFWASGAAFFVRSELFHQFGGFDPQFFAHLEEIDLCWRMKRAGYKIVCDPSVHVYHLGGGTLPYNAPKKVFLNFRNSLIALVKNERPLDILWKVPTRLLLDYVACILFLTQGKLPLILSVLHAHVDFILTLPLSVLKRRYHQKEILAHRIRQKPNLKGVFFGSMIWDFYLNQRKTFRDIVK
ncbi:MAG TPA: bifunctional riboflavin kinase/FAD synthetase [Saprospiraceae bacterium]|mgnify:CR=1 FL=1|nr:bifunctional riboflavin kinase/FAD synthetase [Saprospiraceae bacterium]